MEAPGYLQFPIEFPIGWEGPHLSLDRELPIGSLVAFRDDKTCDYLLARYPDNSLVVSSCGYGEAKYKYWEWDDETGEIFIMNDGTEKRLIPT